MSTTDPRLDSAEFDDPGGDVENDYPRHAGPAPMTTQAVTVTLTLNGLPDSCPHCGEQPWGGQWDLLVLGGLQVSCPVCFTAVAPVRAVAATDPECE